jgi:hypothetical protein
MGLEDDLKARTSALISQQMANWVVEIQRAIQGHQAALVRALDELGETVARYDEKVDEQAIASAVTEVLSQQSSLGGGADYSGLKASIAALEKGGNLSEVLTHLVAESAKQMDRAAMFIIKNNAAVGWYARGFDHPDAIRSVNVPLTADTVFRLVHSSRTASRAHVSHSPATVQALARLGGEAQSFLAVPLILRDKVSAVLYCDSAQEEVPQGQADFVEVLAKFAGKVIDLLSAAPRPAGAVGTTPGGARPVAPAAAAPEFGTGTIRPQPAPPLKPPTAPPTRVPAAQPQFTPAPPSTPPTRVGAPALAPEDQKAHDDAKRFARLVVSEIKLYNEAKVAEGRKSKDIYERLKEDIERGRQMYQDRVSQAVRDVSDYFHDELVRILAGGDAGALGPM